MSLLICTLYSIVSVKIINQHAGYANIFAGNAAADVSYTNTEHVFLSIK